MEISRNAVRQAALDIIKARGGIYACELHEATGCSTQLSAGVLKELCKDSLIERREEKRKGKHGRHIIYRYYPVRENPKKDDVSAAFFALCDPSSSPNFSLGVEMDIETSDLRIDLLSLRERQTTDAVEEGFCYGIKYAIDAKDWLSVQAHLERYEDHLKEKFDRVHKLLVRVRRKNRRK